MVPDASVLRGWYQAIYVVPEGPGLVLLLTSESQEVLWLAEKRPGEGDLLPVNSMLFLPPSPKILSDKEDASLAARTSAHRKRRQ